MHLLPICGKSLVFSEQITLLLKSDPNLKLVILALTKYYQLLISFDDGFDAFFRYI